MRSVRRPTPLSANGKLTRPFCSRTIVYTRMSPRMCALFFSLVYVFFFHLAPFIFGPFRLGRIFESVSRINHAVRIGLIYGREAICVKCLEIYVPKESSRRFFNRCTLFVNRKCAFGLFLFDLSLSLSRLEIVV